MQTLRSWLAFLLLLCFTRVLLPEAWVLQLHAHEHTTEEPTQQLDAYKGKLLLSVKHQHCAVDHFYDVPFQLAPPLELPVVVAPLWATAATPRVVPGWHSTRPSTADLRGPPSRS